MNLSDSLGQWWQYIVAGASALGVAAASHLKVRDRVKTLEIRQVIIEERAETLEDTHDTVIRLEGRMTMLSETMEKTVDSQARVESSLEKIGRLIKL
jgi:predicted secreted protein